MKVSVIISLCDNRFDYFCRALDTWSKQTEKDFELVLVDDGNRKEIPAVCKMLNCFQYQYIKIDNSKCDLPITTFTPVLSNNVGMRMARGDVICITGPETLQNKNNIKYAATFVNRKECGYGLIYKSNRFFVSYISQVWNKTFDGLLDLPGAKSDCLTCPPHPPAYYYFAAVKKEYVERIGGLDERFGQGYCAEDDDFANRIRMSGITPIFEHRIVGIHQDHSAVNTKKHAMRFQKQELRQRNIALMRDNLQKHNVVVNNNHIWGDPKVITHHEVF